MTQAHKILKAKSHAALTGTTAVGQVYGLALCHDSDATGLGAVTRIALNAQRKAPDWIHLLPKGPDIVGFDGRTWKMSSPDAVVTAFNSRATDLIVDYEHGSEYLADAGLPAPASGWINQIELRDDGIWGKVAWTEKATNMIEAGEYRYISPGFTFDKETREVRGFKSVGLVNQPNLQLTALNRQQQKESALDLAKICKALGLAEDAGPDEILTAVNSLKTDHETALNKAQTPATDQFVPMETHTLALNKATTLQAKLDARDAADHKAAVDTALNKALADGKIAPANQDYYRKSCETPDGLTAFNSFIATAPVVVPKGERVTKPAITAITGTALNTLGLTEAEVAMCKATGTDQAAFAKTKAAHEEDA